jgi:hypothetical protein
MPTIPTRPERRSGSICPNLSKLFASNDYAKNAGGLLLVRPRVLGNKAYDFLETKEPQGSP